MADNKKQQQMDQLAKSLPYLTGFLALGVAFAGYFLLITPQLGRLISGGTHDIAPFRQVLEDEKKYSKSLASMRDFVNHVNPQAKEGVEAMVPDTINNSDIMVKINGLAEKSGLRLESVSIAPESSGGTLSGFRNSAIVTANIIGADYTHLKTLMVNLEKSNRIMDLLSISFSREAEGHSLRIRVYYLNKEAVLSSS